MVGRQAAAPEVLLPYKCDSLSENARKAKVAVKVRAAYHSSNPDATKSET